MTLTILTLYLIAITSWRALGNTDSIGEMAHFFTSSEGYEFPNSTKTVKSNNEGQSVIEFIFMLPLLIGMSTLLVNINTAIQMGIVNQQYARFQTLFLTFNSPF
ncbi:MAG: hypothetical protein ABIQ95_09460, partial [Bdellovibrionia bacterium]